MTLNILFMTVTIKKKIMSANEYLHQEMIKKIEDENRIRQSNMNFIF